MSKKNFVGPKGARLLRKVAKHILAEPKRYNQDLLIERGVPGETERSTDQPFAACGTMACIAGWVSVLEGHPHAQTWDFARRTLGIDHGAALRLFDTVAGQGRDGWPDTYAQDYICADTPEERARIAAARIEHFIKTGE